jgi:hypothetical protein
MKLFCIRTTYIGGLEQDVWAVCETEEKLRSLLKKMTLTQKSVIEHKIAQIEGMPIFHYSDEAITNYELLPAILEAVETVIENQLEKPKEAKGNELN